MSKYRTPYIKSHCIELFFRYGEKTIHAMTDGNRFPDALNELERNRKIQKEVAERARPGVFDNIVIVMDYSVTKQIFKHFYGPEASYEGYMSKFLTCQPFYYSLDFTARHTLYHYISEMLGLNDLVECMPNMKKHISAMSVRDIERVINFDYKSRQKQEKTQIMAYSFSCDLPIFKLLCLMIECGLDKKEIQEDLALQNDQNVASYIELVYPLHLQASDSFINSYQSGNFYYDAKFKGDVAEKIEVEKVGSRYSTTIDLKKANIKFFQVFYMLEQCYNVASLKE